MAIRKKTRSNGKISFIVYWVNPYTGKQENKTFYTEKEAKKYEGLIKYKLKYDNEDFQPAEEIIKNSKEISIEDAFFLFLKAKQYSLKTTTKFLSIVKMVLENFGHIQLKGFNKKNFDDIKFFLQHAKYANAGKEGTISKTYIYHQLKNLKAVIAWSFEEGFIDTLPAMKVGVPQYQKFIPPTIEEVEALISVSPPHLVRVIILGAYIGLRVGESELFTLTWDKVDLHNGNIMIDTSQKNINRPLRYIPIRKDLLPIFKNWYQEDKEEGISFVVSYRGKGVKSIKNAWATACKLIGIERDLRPYDLRHTFATQLIKEGVDVGTVANLMGHSSL